MQKEQRKGERRKSKKPHFYSLAELSKNTPENSDKLREIYRKCRADKYIGRKLVVHTLLKSASLSMSEAKFCRWLKPNSPPFSPTEHLALAKYFADQGWIDVRSKPQEKLKELFNHSLFHAVTVTLDIPREKLAELAARAEGVYALWRNSLLMESNNRCALGMLEIWLDHTDGAICTRETTHYKGDVEKGISAQTDVLDGYLFQKDEELFILSARESHQGLQIIFLHSNSIASHEKTFSRLYGMAAGKYQEKFFARAIYLERWPGKKNDLENQLDLVDRSKVPELVHEYLWPSTAQTTFSAFEKN